MAMSQAQRRSQMIDGLQRIKQSSNLAALNAQRLGPATPAQKDEVNALLATIIGSLRVILEVHSV